MGLEVGDYTVGEVLPPGWRQTSPTMPNIEQLLASLAANHSAITSLVPNRHDFLDGEVGFSISDGGLDMYDNGNSLSTPFDSSVIYTNGVVTEGSFGTDSQYFTEKYPGLFVLVATDTSVTYFQITGGTGHDGAGTVDSVVLSTSVSGQTFTLFVKRTYGTTNPTINHIVIVRGDGNGATHQTVADTNSDYHFMNNMAGTRELYYLLVSTTNGQFLADADVLDVANAFLQNITLGADRSHRVSVGPGEDVENVDFGNLAVQPLLGDYNRDSSVDAADYVVWRKLNGTSPIPSYEGADGDGDSAIDSDDLGVWAEHFGESPSVGSGSGTVDSSVAVAESGFTSDVVVAESVHASDDSPRDSDNRMNRRILQADVYAEMFSALEPVNSRSATIARQQRVVNGSSADAVAVALQTWLGRTRQLESSSDDCDSSTWYADDPPHESFELLDAALESVAESLSRSSMISRSRARLAVLR
jgi:hypothetical protein